MKDIDDDLLVFADETTQDNDDSVNMDSWKIIIADDDTGIHSVTRLVLENFVFLNKKVQFLSAYSSKETIELLKKNPETAIILLDVVMEEDDAGLKTVKYIRDVLDNKIVRIILRTGQPGQAPEEKVIVDYDINDYKAKTELTSQKLNTSIISALRSYNDLVTIENNKKGLEKIIEASANIFEIQSMKKFASGVLSQLISIMNLNRSALFCKTSGFTITNTGNDELIILAATGNYSYLEDKKALGAIPDKIMADLDKARTEKKSVFFDDRYICYFHGKSGSENFVFIEGAGNLSELDRNLIEVFCSNVSIAYDNIYLNQEIEDTQKEIIFKLGEIIEAKSKETGSHVRRVAEYSRLLAILYGLREEEAEIIKLSSPMHDIGKLGIPDSILNKPTELTPEEIEIIKTHPSVGYEMLKKSNRDILKTAAIISREHHEKYNGEGYPNGLAGENISIYGRITALADVFDALGSDRVYRKACDDDYIKKYFAEESGKHFDPKMVTIFLDNYDKFLNIKKTI